MRALRKSKSVEILLRLLDRPRYVRELVSEVGGSAQTVEMRIQELLKEGLVEEEVWEAWPFRKMLKLTERGKNIAGLLKVEQDFFTVAKKIANEDATRRGGWLLTVLHAVGGVVRGATKLQKLLFLLKRELGIEAPYNFTPYMFGPHSPDVLDDAIDLETVGYIKIEKEVLDSTLAGDCIIERKYELTPEGAKAAGELYKKLPADEKKALRSLGRFNEMTLTELLKYVYTKYPKESRGL
ncbi:MAG TPA: ArsR family transcriptional regulator [Hadesarchaea archaeon]|nr:ArsR family transcriptional regulator [Hadesarchaea archaeon]